MLFSGLKKLIPLVLCAALNTAMSQAVVNTINSVQEFEQLCAQAQQHNKLVVVDFYADWCGPCRNFAPVFESVSRDVSDQALFIKINGDEFPQLLRKYGVDRYPTIIILKDGVQKRRMHGSQTKDVLKNALQ